MCGIVALCLNSEQVTPVLVDCLTTLQHRGQDAAGIATSDGNNTHIHKMNGQVTDLIENKEKMNKLTGKIGIGHVRYPTAGSSSVNEAQPFYTNCPFGLALAHNGNLTNTQSLRRYCRKVIKRQINTGSDSEVILSIFADELSKSITVDTCAAMHTDSNEVKAEEGDHDAPEHSDENEQELPQITIDCVFDAVSKCMERFSGGYSVVVLINGLGVVAFRDPCGIRPLCYGTRRQNSKESKLPNETAIASESVAVEIAGFNMQRDIAPGEAILVDLMGNVHFRQCINTEILAPCIFEYVYFARQDSVIDGASVYATRVNMGTYLARRIQQLHPDAKIDVVVPVPATSRISAIQCAITLGVPYEEGLVRNRYSGRTFIMPGQERRKKSVRLKLNPISRVIKGRSVLLVDDSIVRGTTSRHIVEMVRSAGATHVYFASAAPPIRYPNVYGIDMPTRTELIAFNRTEKDIAQLVGADWVCYQDLEDLKRSVQDDNPRLLRFDTSCFDGEYIAEPLSDAYFESLHANRNDAAQSSRSTCGSPVALPMPPTFTRSGSFVCDGDEFEQPTGSLSRKSSVGSQSTQSSEGSTIKQPVNAAASAFALLQLSPKKKSRRSSADHRAILEGFQKQRNLTPSSSSLAE